MNLCIRCVPISVTGLGVGTDDKVNASNGADEIGADGASVRMVDDNDVLS